MENNLNKTKQANVTVESQNISDDDIDLRELFAAIWKGKWIIIAVTVLFAVASVIYAISQPNIYKSEALLAPAEQERTGGLSALASQFGGLASLAGVNLAAGGGIDKTQMALEVLQSRQFVSEFIQRHNILPDLMAAESWSRETNTVNYNQALYIKSEDKWVREVEASRTPEPSMQEAFKTFRRIVSANRNKETGMITISVEHVSPEVAQQWVNWLVKEINTEMKVRDVQEANRSTSFLNNQLEQTRIADIRTVLYKLVEEQTKTIMFANVREEYVFKTIDPAIVPEQRSSPERALICILGVLLGGVLSVMLVLIRYFLVEK